MAENPGCQRNYPKALKAKIPASLPNFLWPHERQATHLFLIGLSMKQKRILYPKLLKAKMGKAIN